MDTRPPGRPPQRIRAYTSAHRGRPAHAASSPPVATAAPGPQPRAPLAASIALGLYLLISAVLAHGLWAHPRSRLLADNQTDSMLTQWWLAWGAHVVGHLANPLLTPSMNAPFGLNTLGNTSILGPSILLSPITLLFGPGLSFTLLVTLAPALTAWTTYLAVRRFGVRPTAAGLGGLFVCLAPGIHAQTLGHLQMSAALLIPLILADVVGLAIGRGRTRTVGLRLGLLLTLQVFFGEEWLAIVGMTAAALALVALVLWPTRALDSVPRFAAGLGWSALVAVPLLAGPVGYQLLGPEAIHESPFLAAFYANDVHSFTVPDRLLLFSTKAQHRYAATRLHGIPTEENGYLGWPVISWLVLTLAVLRRQKALWALTFAGVLVALASMGPYLLIGGRRTKFKLPWDVFDRLPLLREALPDRFALVLYLLIGAIVALVAERAWRIRFRGRHGAAGTAAVLGVTTLVVLSVSPHSFATIAAPARPAAFDHQQTTTGTVLTIPILTSGLVNPLLWEAQRGLPDRLAGFYSLVPDGNRTLIETGNSPLTQLIAEIDAGTAPTTQPTPDSALRVGANEQLTPAAATVLTHGLKDRDVCVVDVLAGPQQDTMTSYLTPVLGAGQNIGGVVRYTVC